MNPKTLTMLSLLIGLSAACTSSSSPRASATSPTTFPSTPVPSPTAYQPNIDPANFTNVIDNPLFPLKPGTLFTYKGVRDGQTQTDVVQVTAETKMIMGITAVAVQDTATHGSRLLEKTTDWYAQDLEGNVWYFGEDTAEYKKNGEVATREGSWLGGVGGAQPGIIMPAHPEVPLSYRQEFLAGHAEDMAWIIDSSQPTRVPYGSFQDALLTVEWTRLEPDVLSEKVYAPGVGLISEHDVAGGDERSALVSVKTG
jgi:hypothetical protein